MCKLLIIPHIPNNEVIRQNINKFISAVTGPLCSNDRDGFGYAMLDSKGGIYGQKWVNPKSAFKKTEKPSRDIKELLDNSNKLLTPTEDYESFGGLNKGAHMVSIMLHARASTNSVCIENTHPFYHENTALIHNGVITNHMMLKKINSTCDSEVILDQYIRQQVKEDAENFQKVSDNLVGYFACGIMTPQFVDIVKDDRAELCAISIPKLKTVVFCTSLKIVKKALKVLGWEYGQQFEIADCSFIRFNPNTGHIEKAFTFETADIEEWKKRFERTNGKATRCISGFVEGDHDYISVHDALRDRLANRFRTEG